MSARTLLRRSAMEASDVVTGSPRVHLAHVTPLAGRTGEQIERDQRRLGDVGGDVFAAADAAEVAADLGRRAGDGGT